MIDPETRDHAKGLYVTDCLSLKQVSGATGIKERTIENWSAEDDWPGKRKEHLERKQALKEKLDNLREHWMDKAMESDDHQVLFAVYRLEELAEKRRQKTEGRTIEIDRPRLFLEDMEFVAGVLKEIDPRGLKVLARNFEVIVERFKKKNEEAT